MVKIPPIANLQTVSTSPMSPDRLTFFLTAVVLVFLGLFRKMLPGYVQVILIVIFISGFFLRAFGGRLPGSVFGNWNVISGLEGDRILEIRLIPSEPEWQVNLSAEPVIIDDQQVIDSLCDMLRHCSAYFPDRDDRIWEAGMVLRTDRDTLHLQIHQTADAGTVIFKGNNNWRHAELGKFLEVHTGFTSPAYGNR